MKKYMLLALFLITYDRPGVRGRIAVEVVF